MSSLTTRFGNYSSAVFVALLVSAIPAWGDTPAAHKVEPSLVDSNDKWEERSKPVPVELAEEPIEEPGEKKKEISSSPFSRDSAGVQAATATGDDLSWNDFTKPGAKDQPNEQISTLLNVKEADIATLIKAFSKLTNRNYIVDNNVKGKITIHLPSPVSLTEAVKIFDSVLLLRGFTTVPMGSNTYKVVPVKNARQSTIPLLTNSPENPSDILVTQLVRLKHVAAEDLQQLLGQFVGDGGVINSFPSTNSLIIIDSSANIERIAKLVDQLDVPAQDQDITIIPVKHAEAKDVADKILDILGEKEGSGQGRSNRSATGNQLVNNPVTAVPQPGQNNRPTGATAERSLPLKVIPDERTNSIIIVADVNTTTKVRALVDQLDSPVDLSGGKFYVYRLKHADAEDLAGILSDLISGNSGGGSSRSSSEKLSGSSISRSQRSSGGNSRYGSSNSGLSGSSTDSSFYGRSRGQLSTKPPGTDPSKVNFEGEVSVAPDPSTNSLIISSSRTDYLRLKQVIDQLDIKRRQVLVEATLLEVSLENQEGMGVELQGTAAGNDGGVFGQTNWGGLTNLLTDPASLSDLTLAAVSTGTLTLGSLTIPSQAMLISAVSKHSNVNVLSSPNILTMDNQEAEILVGENVPFVVGTQQDNSNTSSFNTQVERQDVGITLRITPQISTGQFVTLRIFVEISNVVPGTQGDRNGPTTRIRTTETVVEVKNNQMIVTGGLIADAVQEAQRGVPFFEDIPVLGSYFRRNDDERRRNNLLVFLTPRILKDQFDAREATQNSRDRVEKTVVAEDIAPSRMETLHSDRIDDVVEEGDIKVVPPSTITGPNSQLPLGEKERAALERTKERLKALTSASGSQSESAHNTTGKNNSDVIEVKVRPRLPGDNESLPVGSEARPRLAVNTDPTAVRGEASYVVLKELGEPNTHDSSLPLADSKEGLVALKIPGAAASKQVEFFQAGTTLSYQSSAGVRRFVCLGRYLSPKEASVMHPSLAAQESFRELSAGEIRLLNGGAQTNGPWKQEEE